MTNLPLQVSLGIKGTLVVHGKDGEVLKRIDMNGSIPLSKLGITQEEAETMIKQQEALNGSDNCDTSKTSSS